MTTDLTALARTLENVLLGHNLSPEFVAGLAVDLNDIGEAAAYISLQAQRLIEWDGDDLQLEEISDELQIQLRHMMYHCRCLLRLLEEHT